MNECPHLTAKSLARNTATESLVTWCGTCGAWKYEHDPEWKLPIYASSHNWRVAQNEKCRGPLTRWVRFKQWWTRRAQ